MIELRRIKKSFGITPILRDISLTVKQGEFLTLLGPSGSGKTTALRIISGFETPDSGEVLLGDRDITGEAPCDRDINQIFQSYALFPHLNVAQNIGFGLMVRGLPRAEICAKVARALASVDLKGTENRFPTQLSGGERQRVAIARAIVCEPKVLLLDEPLSALDMRLQEQMKNELKALQQRLGITFIYVTHDQDHALTLSDRIVVLNRGQIEQVGTPTDLYHRPATRFVASFVGETNLISAELVSSNGHHNFRLQGGLLLAADRSEGDASNSNMLSMRPEKLHLARTRTDAPNTFRCRVEKTTFRGAMQTVSVVTAGGLKLSTLQTVESGSSATAFKQGEDVFCSVAAEDIVLVSEN